MFSSCVDTANTKFKWREISENVALSFIVAFVRKCQVCKALLTIQKMQVNLTQTQ